jgi:carbonic anhydrase/acetyltransferase-like protein (isoleucine patch superfamily)
MNGQPRTPLLKAIDGKQPLIHDKAFVAENAVVIGDARIAQDASLWYGAVLRADVSPIEIGCKSCVEDNAVVHGNTSIGQQVVIGHSAVLHGCTIGDGCLVGMNATILDGAVIGPGSIVAAGSTVTKGKAVPSGSLVAGTPARVVRQLSQKEKDEILSGADFYVDLAVKQLPRFESYK